MARIEKVDESVEYVDVHFREINLPLYLFFRVPLKHCLEWLGEEADNVLMNMIHLLVGSTALDAVRREDCVPTCGQGVGMAACDVQAPRLVLTQRGVLSPRQTFDFSGPGFPFRCTGKGAP